MIETPQHRTGEALIAILQRESSVRMILTKVNLELRIDKIPIPGWDIRVESDSIIGNTGVTLNCNALEIGTCVALKAILDRCEREASKVTSDD